MTAIEIGTIMIRSTLNQKLPINNRSIKLITTLVRKNDKSFSETTRWFTRTDLGSKSFHSNPQLKREDFRKGNGNEVCFDKVGENHHRAEEEELNDGIGDLVRSEGCLTGIKVLDLSRVLAGPSAAQLLGDLGAEVIKIEEPRKGDDTRYFKTKKEQRGSEEKILSDYFISCNRNKRSLTLNLKSEDGIKIFKELVKSSDVLIENLMTGKMEELGIGYKTLKSINPNLIYSRITGFGSSGPLKSEPGYDVVAAAKSGLMSITGEKGRSPMKNGVAVCDIITGLHCVIGIISSLYSRDRIRKIGSDGNGPDLEKMTDLGGNVRADRVGGQLVDVSLFESSLSILFNVGSSFLNSQEDGQRWGTEHPSIVPYQAFETHDDIYVIISATNDRQFQKLCEALNLEGLSKDPRFKTNEDRVKNRAELIKVLSDRFKNIKKSKRGTEEMKGEGLNHKVDEGEEEDLEDLLRRIKSFGLPCSRVNSVKEGFEEEQARARQMIKEVVKIDPNKNSKTHSIKLIGTPIKLSKNPIRFDDKDGNLAPPHLGQHTNSILRDQLGYSDDNIKSLKESGAI